MAKTATKRKEINVASIKRRLSAALIMLLVSSIMLVATTYAWFTLSTAPEVRSIDTTVAGNGSLEIALLPGDGSLAGIESGRAAYYGGGSVPALTANTTWGNLISLDNAAYGLQTLKLNPASFDATQSKIKIPSFGYDGRIISIEAANYSLNAYDVANEAFTKTTNEKGVRAIVITEGNAVATYGYVIDLAFRLNAKKADGSNAHLQLQKNAAQRVYTDSSSENTQGSGSRISVTNQNNGSNLAQALRIAFVKDFGINGATPTVLAFAKADNNGYLDLYSDIEAATPAENLLEMNKNQTYQVSAIVWLEGSDVNNRDFKATEETLSSVTLNLQFKTDAALIPSEDYNLKTNPPAPVVEPAQQQNP